MSMAAIRMRAIMTSRSVKRSDGKPTKFAAHRADLVGQRSLRDLGPPYDRGKPYG